MPKRYLRMPDGSLKEWKGDSGRTDGVGREEFDAAVEGLTPTYSGGNLQIGDDITTGVEWNYADGMPENNGLTYSGTAGKAVMQDGGVLLSAGAEYKFPALTAKAATLECVFSIPAFATFQYGFRMQLTNGTTGVRISCYLNELRFNQNTNGNTTVAQLETDTEYTLRIEWNETNGANVYLNGTQVLTGASTKYALDEIDIGQFHSGTTLLKFVSFQCEAGEDVEIKSINGVGLCDEKARNELIPVSAVIDANNLVSFLNAAGVVLFTLKLNGGGVPDVPDEPDEPDIPSVENLYKAVTWNTTAVSAGEVDEVQYYAWCPHNLQYDKTRGKFVFLQHRSNSHSSGAKTSVLSYLDPANPTTYEPINFPSTETCVHSLLVKDDGTWTVFGRANRYTTKDGGKTWTTEAITGLARSFGVWQIGNELYGGDDLGTGVYYHSTDGGLTWTAESFGDVGAYGDCEASFCEFKGEIYAFLRTNQIDYIVVLRKTTDGWELVNNDKILCYNSTACPVAFDDKIAIAHCNRKDQHLYYTTWDGADEWITEDLGEMGGGGAGDFHTASLAFGNGYAAIAFFTHSNESSEYNAAINAWLIGAYEPDRETLIVKNTLSALVYDAIDLLTEYAPEDAVEFTGAYRASYDHGRNPNEFAVTKYGNDMLGWTVPNGGHLIPMAGGKIISFERGFMTSASKNGASSVQYAKNYQKQPILVVDGVYHRLFGRVLHRRNKIIYGAELSNMPMTDTPVKGVYYAPEDTVNDKTGAADKFEAIKAVIELKEQ